MLQELTILTFTLLLWASTLSQQSCSPKRLYCGSQILELHPRLHNTTLWQCGLDGKSLNISYTCDNGCKAVQDKDSYCLCKANTRYCGYELMDIGGWRGYENHSLYNCDDVGLNTSLIETCPQQCKVASQSYCSGQCQDGQFYCGYRLNELGWDGYENDTLYQCRGGNETSVWSKCPPGTCNSDYCKCIPGQYYCGHELYEQLGWTRFESRQMELQKCAPNGSLVFSQYACGKCISGDPRPTCECKTGSTYCGYTLHTMGWDGYDNDTLYLCENGQNGSSISKLMACGDGKCRSGDYCECSRDEFYCGHELYHMGWRQLVNHQTWLGRCTNGTQHISWVMGCETCYKTGNSSKCDCKSNYQYCGHELLKLGWVGHENNTLYQCDGGYNAKYTKSCHAECIEGTRHSFCGGECLQGTKHCGSKINQMGFKGYRNDSVYLCENNLSLIDTGEKNDLCGQGCTPGRSYCGHEVQYIRDIANDDMQKRYICNSSKSFHSIDWIQSCKNCHNTGNGSRCSCVGSFHYCGYELFKLGWEGYEKNTLYQCDGGVNVKNAKMCHGECITGEGIHSSFCGGECVQGTKYCGSRINQMGYKGYSNGSIYICENGISLTDTGEKNVLCSQGCTPGRSYCGYELQYNQNIATDDLQARYVCNNDKSLRSIAQCTNCINDGNGAYCQCIPGWRYCASIVYNTGWKGFGETISLPKNFTNDTIFRCKDEENVEYVETCATNECKPIGSGSAHCLCSTNRTYCGHELYQHYNSMDTYLYPHYIYRCSRSRLSVIEEVKCANCYRLAGIPTCRQECSVGQYYCGSDLLLLEGWKNSDTLSNWLYRCDNSTTAQPIAECTAGCNSNSSVSGQDATCNPSSTAWYWFFGGVSVPLVFIGLGFLLVRSILKHRRLKKFLEEQRIDVSQLTTIKILGEGEFGEVWQGTYRNTDGILRDVALKLSKEKTDAASKLACANCFLQEVVALDIVSHRNIIKVFGICLNFRFKDQCGNTVPALVLEYMNGGSAISYMRSERNRLTGRDLLHIFSDICHAGDHLFKLGIIHRDIGARNVLVQKDPHTGHVIVAKLTDFGLAKDIGKLTSMYKAANLDQNMFHFRYTAPEGFRGCFCSKSDVWSFGVFMWELYTVMEEQDGLADLRLEQGRSGPVPYFSLDTVADVLTEACSDRKLKQPKMAPEKMYKIMRQCWETEEDLRPSFEELIKFFNTNCDGSEIQAKAIAVDVSHKDSDSKNGHGEKQEEHHVTPHGYVSGSS